ncbi:sodium:solute symporter family protein, partial [bacterium]|nr:sodium:solute symporter family protein [bacterium]
MMEQIVGTKLDYAIIIIYFIFVLGFGSVFGRFTRTTKEFFFGGQRFSWWLIAFSCVATTVGSYSFIKYSAAGYRYGMSSTMTYLNDWFMMPLFMLGWLPIIYFSRVSSIPEFFERRFDRQTRVAAVVVLMLYMIGYIGINFYTLGVALNALLGWDIFKAAVFIAVITGIYVTFGGQTAVIMTDLLQGFLLLIAGFALFFLGVHYLGGWGEFWHHLPLAHRLPFSGFNTPEKFPMVGIFWQDAMANSLAFWFMNQGLIMRFLSVKSVREGRKSATFVILLLMPLASIAVANAGWVGKAMVGKGMLPANVDANKIFVLVSDLICRPGVFGFI